MRQFITSLFGKGAGFDRLAAAVTFVNGRLLIASTSLTRPGFFLDHSYDVLHPPVTAGTVAAALRQALDGSSDVLPGPSRAEFEERHRDLLHLAGVRSRKALMDEARHLSLEERDGRFELHPSVNCGKEGFVGAADKVEVFPAGDLSPVAERVLTILGV